MTRDEFFELDAADAAAELNKGIEAGQSKDEVLEAHGITQADLMKAQIFFVKGKFIARVWGGYTSTKRTGNEAGDSEQGVGRSDPSKGYAGI
ncbi:MAG: hypothetical protein U0L71_02345 [Eggerthellaceae bacterium]|nr:hypothetical protein [Eggerthellaceae bacterium]